MTTLHGEHVEIVLRTPLHRANDRTLFSISGSFDRITADADGGLLIVLGRNGAYACIPTAMVGAILSDGEHPMVPA